MSYRQYGRECGWCKKLFMAARIDAGYCSSKCRVSRHRSGDKANLVDLLTAQQKEDLWLVRDCSRLAERTIQAIYNIHGLQAAKMALLACIQTYGNSGFNETDKKVNSDV